MYSKAFLRSNSGINFLLLFRTPSTSVSNSNLSAFKIFRFLIFGFFDLALSSSSFFRFGCFLSNELLEERELVKDLL